MAIGRVREVCPSDVGWRRVQLEDLCEYALGGSCVTMADCESSLQCQRGVCKRNLGGSCSSDDECAEGSCLRQTCTQAQPLGSVCESDRGCVAPNQCIEDVCRIPSGGTCVSSDDCGTGVCLGAVCKTQPAPSSLGLGEACNADSQCISRSCNWQNVCATPVGPTYNCNSNADCTSGRRCTNMSTPTDTGYCCDSTPNDGC